MRRLEKIFLSVVANTMSDTRVKAIASEPLSAKHQREFLKGRIKKLQDRHRIFRGVLGSSGLMLVNSSLYFNFSFYG